MAKRNKLAVFSVVALGMMFFAEQNKACTRAVYLGPDDMIANLSGGNQQKVIIARWLANNPDILIMDEPTRGIDVGAKYEIYQIMIDLVKQGKSIIMISSEMPELIGMSNRIIVMCNGRITGEVEGEEATQERIMSFATQFDLQGKSTTESKQED